jgi:hypothetical protein
MSHGQQATGASRLLQVHDVIPSLVTGVVSAAAENGVQRSVRRVGRGRWPKTVQSQAEPGTKLTQVRSGVADCCPSYDASRRTGAQRRNLVVLRAPATRCARRVEGDGKLAPRCKWSLRAADRALSPAIPLNTPNCWYVPAGGERRAPRLVIHAFSQPTFDFLGGFYGSVDDFLFSRPMP